MDKTTASGLEESVRKYQSAIRELPSLNRQLALYLLDLFAHFLSKSDLNGLTTEQVVEKYCSVFFPVASDSRVAAHQKMVLDYLIQNQDDFLMNS